MRNLILGLLFIIFLVTASGCQTVKMGVGAIGKGLADDAYNTWKVIERADEWFKENCW